MEEDGISLLNTGLGDLVLLPTQPCANNTQPESLRAQKGGSFVMV